MEAICSLEGEVVALALIIAWLLWYPRILVVNCKSSWLASSIVERAENLLTKYKAANWLEQLPREPSKAKWVSPAPNVFKVNFDASRSIVIQISVLRLL